MDGRGSTEVGRWQRFLDSLDSSGGHILVGLLLMGTAIGLEVRGIASGPASGALLLYVGLALKKSLESADDGK